MGSLLNDKIKLFIQKMPKTELHLHLEGAIPVDTLFSIINKKNKEISSLQVLHEKLKYTDFPNFIKVWNWKNKFIDTEDVFTEITYRVLENLSRQSVKYAEVFYSPGDFEKQGLSVKGITKKIINGKEQAQKDFGIKSSFIIDLIRDKGAEKGLHYLDEVTPFLGRGVVGVGIGGSEQDFPARRYREVYRIARERGFKLTAHAGEAASSRSVWEAIKDLRVERVGHGVRSVEDPILINYLKERQIPLEVCPMSNVKTGIYSSIKEHPVDYLISAGLKITINSDDPTMFNTSIVREFKELIENEKLTLDQVKQVSLNSIDSSFLSREEKDEYRGQFVLAWEQMKESIYGSVP